eukprot:gene6630-3288_t
MPMNARVLPVGGRHLKLAVARGGKFVKANPLLSKAVPTAIGFAFGDFLTQFMNRDKEVPFKMEFHKTAKMAAFGACVAGPMGLAVIQSLSQSIPVGAAIAASEVFGCLLWQIAYINICEKYRAGTVRLATSVRDGITARSDEERPQTERSPPACCHEEDGEAYEPSSKPEHPTSLHTTHELLISWRLTDPLAPPSLRVLDLPEYTPPPVTASHSSVDNVIMQMETVPSLIEVDYLTNSGLESMQMS